jgi:hypothetical protein
LPDTKLDLWEKSMSRLSTSVPGCGTEGFCDLCNMRPCACANRFWVGEQVNPEQIAEAVRSEQAKHAGHCPKRWAFVLDCSCGVGS